MYRRRIAIECALVAGGELRDFPLLVAVEDGDLKPAGRGGRVACEGGGDIFFVAGDGQRLPHALEEYDGDRGALRAWVRMPLLAADVDALLYLCCGGDAVPSRARAVWEGSYQYVAGAGGQTLLDGGLDSSRALTVEAWVCSDESRAEAMQVLAARWSLRRSMDALETCDAGQTEGLRTRGFFGALFDGRHVYFAPQYDGLERHGKVLRYDTRGEFKDPQSWAAYNASATCGLNCRGYYGALFDGRYLYFAPRTDGVEFHTRVLRYDTQGEFKDPQSWAAYDVGHPISYQGGAFDGRYLYFAPGYERDAGKSGKVLRYDTRGGFSQPESYALYDAGRSSGLDSKCYDGALFDGRHVYFAPLDAGGIALRYDTRGGFSQPESWEARDASRGEPGLGACVGAVFDGRYVYYVPYGHSAVVRYDTEGDFGDEGSWEGREVAGTSGLKSTGYDGALFDGRYVYFIPFWDGGKVGEGFHAHLLRYDSRKEFGAAASWEAVEAGNTDPPNPGGFNGGAFDGRYLYLAPWREGTDAAGGILSHGKVLRCDTAGEGAAFVLKYMDCGHNGGLCGAVPGPSFLVNTERGVLNVQAHANPGPGWHHIAGVYDGERLALYVDGALVNQQEGGGRIAASRRAIVLGGLAGGGAAFGGTIVQVRIGARAHSAGWIRASCRMFEKPPAFARLEREGADP